jgi:hypothetical protein
VVTLAASVALLEAPEVETGIRKRRHWNQTRPHRRRRQSRSPSRMRTRRTCLANMMLVFLSFPPTNHSTPHLAGPHPPPRRTLPTQGVRRRQGSFARYEGTMAITSLASLVLLNRSSLSSRGLLA